MIGMLVRIPVVQSGIQRLMQLIDGFKALAFECQRAQLLPPRLNQVQPGGVLGSELDLDFRPGEQSGFDIPTMMRTQIILDQQPTLGRKYRQHMLQKPDMAGSIPLVTQDNSGLSGSRFKGAMHPDDPTPPVVRFIGRSKLRGFPFGTRISLHRQGSQFIQTDRAQSGQAVEIGGNYRPLFSTKWGSCCWASWNQLSWRFHSKPSAANHSQIVESDKWMPVRSSNSRCKRSNVHSLKDNPRLPGFWRAQAINWLEPLRYGWADVPNAPHLLSPPSPAR